MVGFSDAEYLRSKCFYSPWLLAVKERIGAFCGYQTVELNPPHLAAPEKLQDRDPQILLLPKCVHCYQLQVSSHVSVIEFPHAKMLKCSQKKQGLV